MWNTLGNPNVEVDTGVTVLLGSSVQITHLIVMYGYIAWILLISFSVLMGHSDINRIEVETCQVFIFHI